LTVNSRKTGRNVRLGVDALIALEQFHVQVVAVAGPRIAHLPNDLPCRNFLVFGYGGAGKMRVSQRVTRPFTFARDIQ
jgi:hypothetical protein